MIKVSLLLLFVSVVFAADPLGMVVPAYFPAWDPQGVADFDALRAAATQLGDRLTIIINMNNGPAPPSWPYFQYFVQFATDIRAAGSKIVGYVYTEYGARDQAAVIADIDAWFDTGCPIDGIFFDQVSTNTETIPSYAALYAHVQLKATQHSLPKGWVILNQGTTAEGLEGFLAVGDILVIKEDRGSTLKRWEAPTWVKSADKSRFLILIWDLAKWSKGFKPARQNNVGNVYFTDLDVNQWNSLPGYWSAFLACVVTNCA